MIALSRVRMVSRGLAALVAVLLSGCGGSESDSTPSCGAVPGQATTSTGSAAGLDNYTLGLGSGVVRFSNLNLTVYPVGVGNEMVDLGAVCLESVGSWPGGAGGRLTVVVGHVYAAKFTTIVNGVTTLTYARFIVDRYQGGVLTVTFVPHL
jgi:hypothetical protein